MLLFLALLIPFNVAFAADNLACERAESAVAPAPPNQFYVEAIRKLSAYEPPPPSDHRPGPEIPKGYLLLLHGNRLEALPGIFRYGYYDQVGFATLSFDPQYDYGPIYIAFKVPADRVQRTPTVGDSNFYGISTSSKVDSLPPSSVLGPSTQRLSRALQQGLLGRLSPDQIDWEQTLDASARGLYTAKLRSPFIRPKPLDPHEAWAQSVDEARTLLIKAVKDASAMPK